MTNKKSKLIRQVILNAHKQVLKVLFDDESISYDIKGKPYYILKFSYINGKLDKIAVHVSYREKPIMFIMPKFIENFLSNKSNLTNEKRHKLIYWANEKSADQKKIKQLIVLNLHDCCIL